MIDAVARISFFLGRMLFDHLNPLSVASFWTQVYFLRMVLQITLQLEKSKNMKQLLISLILGLTTHFTIAQNLTKALTTEPQSFKSESGTVVEAIGGSLRVPENRTNPNSENISIHFIQLKSTNPNSGNSADLFGRWTWTSLHLASR